MKLLVVGDVHEPCAHPGYLAFCQDLYAQWDCDRVHFIGDLADWHAISFHAHHPDMPGPKDEYELAYTAIQRWYSAFPKATVSIGNHDARVLRSAEAAGIPSKFIRDFAETWGTPGWDWDYEHVMDDVYFFHGTGNGGMHPAFNTMKKMGMSTVQGHIHSAGGVKWMVNPRRRLFGLDTGCGIDDDSAAFAYGKHTKVRSVISAAVIIDGLPYHEPCPIGRGEAYHRSKFKKRKR